MACRILTPNKLTIICFCVSTIWVIVTGGPTTLPPPAAQQLVPTQQLYDYQQGTVCPSGWVLARNGQQSLVQGGRTFCLLVSIQATSWSGARDVCRAHNSFLVSLNTLLKVEDKVLSEYLQQRGVNSVWSGVHEEGGRLIWDEPWEGVANSYTSSDPESNLAARGWNWNVTSFNIKDRSTCGLYSVGLDVLAKRRKRDASGPDAGSIDTGGADLGGLSPDMKNMPIEFTSSVKPKDLQNEGTTEFPPKFDPLLDHLTDLQGKNLAGSGNDKSPPQMSDDSKNLKTDKANVTTDKTIPDDEDSSHDVAKRSTEPFLEFTTEAPDSVSNVTSSTESVTTVQIVVNQSDSLSAKEQPSIAFDSFQPKTQLNKPFDFDLFIANNSKKTRESEEIRSRMAPGRDIINSFGASTRRDPKDHGYRDFLSNLFPNNGNHPLNDSPKSQDSNHPHSQDKSPQLQTNSSGHFQDSDGPHFHEMESPHAQDSNSPKSQDNNSPKSQDNNSPKSQDNNSPKSQHNNSRQAQGHSSLKIQGNSSSQVQSNSSPRVQSSGSPQVQAKSSPQVQAKSSPQVQGYSRPQVQGNVKPPFPFVSSPLPVIFTTHFVNSTEAPGTDDDDSDDPSKTNPTEEERNRQNSLMLANMQQFPGMMDLQSPGHDTGKQSYHLNLSDPVVSTQRIINTTLKTRMTSSTKATTSTAVLTTAPTTTVASTTASRSVTTTGSTPVPKTVVPITTVTSTTASTSIPTTITSTTTIASTTASTSVTTTRATIPTTVTSTTTVASTAAITSAATTSTAVPTTVTLTTTAATTSTAVPTAVTLTTTVASTAASTSVEATSTAVPTITAANIVAPTTSSTSATTDLSTTSISTAVEAIAISTTAISNISDSLSSASGLMMQISAADSSSKEERDTFKPVTLSNSAKDLHFISSSTITLPSASAIQQNFSQTEEQISKTDDTFHDVNVKTKHINKSVSSEEFINSSKAVDKNDSSEEFINSSKAVDKNDSSEEFINSSKAVDKNVSITVANDSSAFQQNFSHTEERFSNKTEVVFQDIDVKTKNFNKSDSSEQFVNSNKDDNKSAYTTVLNDSASKKAEEVVSNVITSPRLQYSGIVRDSSAIKSEEVVSSLQSFDGLKKSGLLRDSSASKSAEVLSSARSYENLWNRAVVQNSSINTTEKVLMLEEVTNKNIVAITESTTLPQTQTSTGVRTTSLSLQSNSKTAQWMNLEDCDQQHHFVCASFLTESQVFGLRVSLNAQFENTPSPDAIIILNMTSSRLQPLECPVSVKSVDDIVVWIKDGRPIPPVGRLTSSLASTNPRRPKSLPLDITILTRLGARRVNPALLQGLYWCQVWQKNPLKSVTSPKIFLRFQDVVTVNGILKTHDIPVEKSVFFNKMQDVAGLPQMVSDDMQKLNRNILQRISLIQPSLLDIVTQVDQISSDKDEVEFFTYFCLSTDTLSYTAKGQIVDSYLQSLLAEMLRQIELLRRWNVTLPVEQAFQFTMTEMCSETQLWDTVTGHKATFPSTPVNQRAFSREQCDGIFTGFAMCTGNLRSGARWTERQIDTECEKSGSHSEDKELTNNVTTSSSSGDGNLTINVTFPSSSEENLLAELTTAYSSEEMTGMNNLTTTESTNYPTSDKPKDSVTAKKRPQAPNPGLLVIDEVQIESGNVGDVADRLAEILNSSTALTEVDVTTVADIVDRIAIVPTFPPDVGQKLLQSVSKVLDSMPETLVRAQKNSKATARILFNMEMFGQKLDMSGNDHVRLVTPNIAMEHWTLHRSSDVVIGFGATVADSWNVPLTEPRIVTLRNRTWTRHHLSNFDIAIELPEQLVKEQSTNSPDSLRLSMHIYRKPGLFLSLNDHFANTQVPGDVNSAVISATIGGRKIKDLHDKVRIIFMPIKVKANAVTHCVFWDFSIAPAGGWSSKGCTYNGTERGRDICMCDHLTNFAILLDWYGETKPIDEVNDTALSFITMIGLSLSIFGLSITIITFIFFKKLRQGRAQETLFNMAVALLCSNVVLLVGFKQTAHFEVCLAVAVLLHYFILVSFVWMLIEACLQYLTFVKVLGTYISKYTLKTVLPAWGIPTLPIIAVLSFDYTLYRGPQNYCWMDADAFYYAFALPVGIIILFNLVMFLVIMVSLVRRPQGLRSNQTKSTTLETTFKAAFTMFILLGLTWIFGYLAIADARLVFQYLFTIFSSLQGFFLFIMLVARRRQVREQWYTTCCSLTKKGKCRDKLTSTNSSTGSSGSSQSSFMGSREDSTRTLSSFINHSYKGGGQKPVMKTKPALRHQTSVRSSSSMKNQWD